ncbi:MAG: glutathionylspermidine synthase family protein [Oscillospiraceae bacterium]|nr:glutathionylspermidine synthase family protein [Oscillospiraceae bacterium]
MKLISIPESEYAKYKNGVIFEGYKWDPQYLDNNTIAKHVLIISEGEHNELEKLTEKLYNETVQAEMVLCNNLKLTKSLNLPRKIRKELARMENYKKEKHIRLMRFDFHPVADGKLVVREFNSDVVDGQWDNSDAADEGQWNNSDAADGWWAISEVNSDVPGGFAEASRMPAIAGGLFTEENYCYKDFGEIIVNAFVNKVKTGGKIVLVHCTSYSDDRQAMQFLGDSFRAAGFQVIYAAADHLRFRENKAVCILGGYEGEADAIFRFNPLEWLVDIKPKRWNGYFDTVTPSCNHPVAVFAQTKRFPLVWDRLEEFGVDLTTWRALLPETIEVKDAKNLDNFIYKPVYGRVGEGISIKEACRENEYSKILKDVKKRPKKYMAQKRFNSRELTDENGSSFHVCLGSYCIDGNAAGYYARISEKPRIDSSAADIPVLIEKSVI